VGSVGRHFRLFSARAQFYFLFAGNFHVSCDFHASSFVDWLSRLRGPRLLRLVVCVFVLFSCAVSALIKVGQWKFYVA